MDNESSDDEDARKPAALPRPSTSPPPSDDDGLPHPPVPVPDDTSPVVIPVAGELPFLVTHWLAGFKGDGCNDDDNNPQTAAALEKIHGAAADLAKAFASLGTFGRRSIMPSLAGNVSSALSTATARAAPTSQHTLKNVTFADMKRTWSSCDPNQLNHLLQSTKSVAAAVDESLSSSTAPSNRIQASFEALTRRVANTSSNSGGRTLQDAIVVADENNKSTLQHSDLAHDNAAAVSALHTPLCFFHKRHDKTIHASKEHVLDDNPYLRLESSAVELSREAANSTRRHFDLRIKCNDEGIQIRSMQRSLQYQRDSMAKLDLERSQIVALHNIPCSAGPNNPSLSAAADAQLDEITSAEKACERVMAQLMRQLPFLQATHATTKHELDLAHRSALKDFATAKVTLGNYRDPIPPKLRLDIFNNRTVLNIGNRQAGLDRCLGRGIPRSMGRIRMAGSMYEDRRALLHNRFSHAATINTHLSYPVYCLRFDRTGRYFITGADDYLVKVFCVGGSVVARKTGRDRMDPSSYSRGAVLVCTLKGHSGVINDIGVSSDNAFLATASADGDCRVWGLKDGCPVAILRGHVGGANMVSWSTLTPFRLVTAGADGLARVWDVREACLNRYGAVLGNRPEYHLLLHDKDLSMVDVSETSRAAATTTGESSATAAIPIPEGDGLGNAPELAGPVLPPLPQPAGLVPQQGNADNVGDGQFIANDLIDVGVKLVSKLQHGASVDERLGGPGTRARRSAVSVICVARCPSGGHFATGSDDGICRVWQDDDCSAVEKIDSSDGHAMTETFASTRSRRPIGGLLLSLKGHLSAITDLQYSKRGDRILTASQSDGAVRVWSWTKDPASANAAVPQPGQSSDATPRNVSQLILKLTNPRASATPVAASRPGPSARPNRSPASSIACDVAVWVQDDTKIITSQSELAKQSSNAIVPGSQYLFLWDSSTGHCLIGIPSAHSMACPVVVPHPTLASVICSAGADGVVKLWDWQSGKCIFSHTNIADIGPIEPRDRGKSFGYLDGDFSPDGTVLVLTDDSGRITVLDSSVVGGNVARKASTPPAWMNEQYFSNDYYDLIYDINGYCVERGSERPPHLAPRGARCSHSGAPFTAQVNEAFKGLIGPMPLCARASRWHRQQIRDSVTRVNVGASFSKANHVGQFDPNATTLLQHDGNNLVSVNAPSATTSFNATPQASRSRSASVADSTLRLSSNYRWRDITDIDVGDDEPDAESDDEDFELAETRNGHGWPRAIQDSDSDEMELDVESVVEPSRTSSRRRQQAIDDEDEDDTGDEFEEFVSSNNTPSGVFVGDYESHHFRMPSRDLGNQVHRQWLHRHESSSSYGGRKLYCPQVGDNVVYIPQAHLETLQEFPGVQTPPWYQWPEEAAWPVVRCCIRNIRYRFPFKAYKNCNCIVAKLTLEVTGIPELARDRSFAWPSPNFTPPAKSYAFELNVFESDTEDFVIPLNLYMSRLLALEAADLDNDVQVEAFYADSTEQAEDREYVSYTGRVVGISDKEHINKSHPSLFGCGFCSVDISWGTSNDPDGVSPWNVSVVATDEMDEADVPERPKLTESEKKRVRDALHTIGNMPDVDQFFLYPVELAKYSDYTSRVEVPMDLKFVKNRLDADYYATRYSAAADIRLILVNCQKYNGNLDDLSILASNMVAKFEELVLDEEERVYFHQFDSPITGTPPAASQALPDAGAAAPTSTVQRRSQRVVVERSSLEGLPGSAESNRRQQSRRNRQTSRPGRNVGRARQNSANGERSVLETGTVRTLEQLSSGRGQRGRATRSASQRDALAESAGGTHQVQNGLSNGEGHRRTRQASLRNVSHAQFASDLGQHDQRQRNVSHRALRAGLRNSVYTEVPSDAEDELTSPVESRARDSRNSRRHSTVAPNPGESLEPPAQVRRSLTLRMGSRRLVPDGDGDGSLSITAPTRASRRWEGESRREPTSVAEVPRVSARASRALARDDSSPDHEPVEVHARRRNSTLSAPAAESSDSDVQNQQSRRSPRRRTETEAIVPTRSNGQTSKRRRADFDSNHESEGDDHPEEEDDHDASDSSAHVEASSAESDDDEVDAQSTQSDDSSEVNTKRKSRNRTARKQQVGEAKGKPAVGKRNQRNRRAGSLDLQSRNSRRRGSRHPATYEDPSSSEFGSDVSDHDNRARTKEKAIATKRKAASPKNPRKKIKIEKSEVAHFDPPEKWPEIAIAHITNVTNEVLGQLRELDAERLFWIPVVEAYPELKGTYDAHIAEPMDFRTIEEERMLYYKSITELQADLILVFRNCMEFNESNSPAHETASLMLGLLGDTFNQACEKLQVRVLRHRSG